MLDLNHIYEANDYILMHYGIGPDDDPPGRGSGRYPKGSGENPYQHDTGFAGRNNDLKKKGFSEKERAEILGFKSTGELRAAISIEKDRRIRDDALKISELSDRGLSVKEISAKTGMSETKVRNYISGKQTVQESKSSQVADALKESLKEKRYIDVGAGTELYMGVSKETLQTALERLKAEGYKYHTVKVQQQGNLGKGTTIAVIGSPDTEWKEVVNNPELIKPYTDFIGDESGTVLGLQPVKSISSNRVFINYTDESGKKGGVEQDGLIEIRPNVPDLSLGNSTYAQVRIGVDDTHYMKGMAVYSDEIPNGYDVIYNTNKKVGTPASDVFKPMQTIKDDSGNTVVNQDNPFGATIKPITAGGQYYYDSDGNHYIDNPNGDRTLGAINKVTDQGDWFKWSKQISPQMLSKQPKAIVEERLNETYKDRERELNEILNLTNPTVKRKLLEGYAEDVDAATSHLKAKAFPGQASYAIIPVPSLKGDDNYHKQHKIDGEVYAPMYQHGEVVAAIRYPHAGPFEIPMLRVNNRNPEAIKRLGNAPDAVGINSYIAERLSGADFDGDTVTIIPTKTANIQNAPRLKELKDFDPKIYKFADPNAPGIKSQTKQTEMGKTTNLIADMQIFGAPSEDIAKAVKHSMVVIDSEKHHLDYKKSEMDNDIQLLKQRYQGGGGAKTLITRAKSEKRIDERKEGTKYNPVTGKNDYAIDKNTGELIWKETGKTYKVKKGTGKDPDTLITKKRQEKITKMEYALTYEGDALKLLSSQTNPDPREVLYGNYANKLHALANRARKELVNTPGLKRNPESAKKYAKEVESLNEQLFLAEKNAPKERQAQIQAKVIFDAQKEKNPELSGDKAHEKRLRGQALTAARTRLGASKPRIDISDKEWEAIQAGAISDSKLMRILNNADSDRVRELATPKSYVNITPAMQASIRAMAGRPGITQADIAAQLGISTSSVSKILASS